MKGLDDNTTVYFCEAVFFLTRKRTMSTANMKNLFQFQHGEMLKALQTTS